MIEKITELEKNRMWATETARETLCDKINELVDYVNTLCQEHDIHEEQIDNLQIKTDGIINDIEHLEKRNPCQHEPFDYIGVRPSMAQVSNARPQDRMIGCTTLDIPESYKELHKAPETELERTRKALAVAKRWLMNIGHLNMSDHGLGSEKMMVDWCKSVALHGLEEVETALEQKE